jgi:hypothetical protein
MICWRLSIGILLMTLFIGGCADKSKVVLKVGDYAITEGDVLYRQKVVKYYYPDYKGDTKEAARSQLISSYTMAAVLKSNGFALDDSAVKKEAERIKATSLMPEKLAEIRAIFGDDEAGYFKVYVLPVLAERSIFFEYFTKANHLHEATRAIAEKNLRLLAGEKTSFKKALQSKKFQQNNPDLKAMRSFEFTVDLKAGIKALGVDEDAEKISNSGSVKGSEIPGQLAAKLENEADKAESEEGQRWLNEIIRPLKVGQVSPMVIDRGETWWIVRLAKKVSDQKYLLEGLAFPKMAYEPWLDAEKKKIIIQKL